MFGILGLGFLLGMQHALEADHIEGFQSDYAETLRHWAIFSLQSPATVT